MKSSQCESGPEKDISLLRPSTASPVVLLLAANLEAVVEREGLQPVPVGQLHPQGVLPLAGQLVDVLVPQPVLGGQRAEALRATDNMKGINANGESQ